ncbi:Hypothetical_protein [Hexamita inflata]|uniref:Hypothetical_protein n=1 Tax=Hexamita inflata TaxID=28002 RepID=A0AA86UTF3_9EUKA|nr:Hypothetical protein HINF_LOCUS58590 [Hexamita inflata]
MNFPFNKTNQHHEPKLLTLRQTTNDLSPNLLNKTDTEKANKQKQVLNEVRDRFGWVQAVVVTIGLVTVGCGRAESVNNYINNREYNQKTCIKCCLNINYRTSLHFSLVQVNCLYQDQLNQLKCLMLYWYCTTFKSIYGIFHDS